MELGRLVSPFNFMAKDLYDELAGQFMANRGNRAQLAALFREGVHQQVQEAAEQVDAYATRLNDAINSATVRQVSFLTESVIQLSAAVKNS